ncbi:hypothetical protein [Cohaesibacter intestini]|uniref:hypothetical protein n=1 Tax=Cohaesibacter intestini TaxID=2211145 RepID=UPI000DEBED2D|nr:hypothetical protein [Cohaesibacter intestini]
MLTKNDEIVSRLGRKTEHETEFVFENLNLFNCWIFSDKSTTHTNVCQALKGLEFGNTETVWVPKSRLLAILHNYLPSDLYPDIVIGIGKTANTIVNKIKKRNPSVFSAQFLDKPISNARHDLIFTFKENQDKVVSALKFSTESAVHDLNAEECCEVIHSKFWERQKLFQKWDPSLGSPSFEI